MAAAVAYYAALTFFPVMLILTSGIGLFLRFTYAGQAAQTQMLEAIEDTASPQLRTQIEQILEAVGEGANVGGPLGILTLLITATLLFAQFERAFERIWNEPTRPAGGMLKALRRLLVDRLRAFAMLLGVGSLVIVIFLIGMTLTAIQNYTTNLVPGVDWLWRIVQTLVMVILNAGAFGVLYRTLPRLPARWRESLAGGLFTSIVWEIGRQVLAAYIVGGKYTSAYGVIGSFIAVMIWIYYANAAIFLGAEFVQEICQSCNPKPESNASEAEPNPAPSGGAK
jgi:membrane protein